MFYVYTYAHEKATIYELDINVGKKLFNFVQFNFHRLSNLCQCSFEWSTYCLIDSCTKLANLPMYNVRVPTWCVTNDLRARSIVTEQPGR